MNRVDTYLKELDDRLTSETKDNNFGKKKEELYKFLREAKPLSDINAYIDTKIGKNYREWYSQSFGKAYNQLKEIKSNVIEGLSRKLHLERFGLAQVDRESITKSIFLNDFVGLREVLEPKVGKRIDKIIDLTKTYIIGGDIESDADEPEKLSENKKAKLNKFIRNLMKEKGLNFSEDDLKAILDCFIEEEMEAFQSIIENEDPDQYEELLKIINDYLEVLKRQPDVVVPTLSPNDKQTIRQFVISNDVGIGKDNVDQVTQWITDKKWKELDDFLEGQFGEDDAKKFKDQLMGLLQKNFQEYFQNLEEPKSLVSGDKEESARKQRQMAEQLRIEQIRLEEERSKRQKQERQRREQNQRRETQLRKKKEAWEQQEQRKLKQKLEAQRIEAERIQNQGGPIDDSMVIEPRKINRQPTLTPVGLPPPEPPKKPAAKPILVPEPITKQIPESLFVTSRLDESLIIPINPPIRVEIPQFHQNNQYDFSMLQQHRAIQQKLEEIQRSLYIMLDENVDKPLVYQVTAVDVPILYPTTTLKIEPKPKIEQLPEVIRERQPSVEAKKQNIKIFVLVKFSEKNKKDELRTMNIDIKKTRRSYSSDYVSWQNYVLYTFNIPAFTGPYTFELRLTTNDYLYTEEYENESTLIFHSPCTFKSSSGVAKITQAEQFIVTCMLLSKQSELVQLLGYISERPELHKKLRTQLKKFDEPKDIPTMMKFFKDKPQLSHMYLGVASICYELAYNYRQPDRSYYDQKLFLDCPSWKTKCSKTLEHLQNMFKRVWLGVNFYNSKWYSKDISEIFNNLLFNNGNLNLSVLVGLVHIDNGLKKNRLYEIDKTALHNKIVGHKTCQLEYLYMLLVDASFSVSGRYNGFDRYLQILRLLKQRLSESQYLTQDKRQFQQSYKVAIGKEMDRITAINFQMTYPEKDKFFEVFTILLELPQALRHLVIDSKVEECLKEYVMRQAFYKDSYAVQVISKVFVQPHTFIISLSNYDQTLKGFFFKKEYKRGHLWNEEVIYTPQIMSQDVLIKFSKMVLFKLFLKTQHNLENQKMSTLSNFTDAVVRNNPPFLKIIKIFNAPLGEVTKSPDANRRLVKIFQYAFEKFGTSGCYSNRTIAENSEWLQLFKLEEPLKEHLLTLFMQKLKSWVNSPSNEDKDRANHVMNSLIECPEIPQEERDTLFEMNNLSDPQNISQDDIRKTLIENPKRAKYYSFILTKSHNNQRILAYVTNIKSQLFHMNIKRKDIEHMMKYTKAEWDLLRGLFDTVNTDIGIQELINKINNDCNNVLKKWANVLALLRTFNDKNEKLKMVTYSLNEQYDRLMTGTSKPIDLTIPPSFTPLLELKQSIFQFYNLKIFKDGVKIAPTMDVEQFCLSLNESMTTMCNYIQNFVRDWRNDKIKVMDITNLSQKVGTFSQMQDLLNLIEKQGLVQLTQEEKEDITAVMKYNRDFKNFNRLHKAISYIEMYCEKKGPIDMQQSYDKQFQRINEMNAHKFLDNMRNFTRKLERLEINPDQQENDINKVLERTVDGQQLHKIVKANKDKIEQLKDYMNDQDESFLNAKNITEFEFVSRYYSVVLEPANNIEDYMQRLRAFLDEQTKADNPQSLAACFESCLTLRLQIQRKFEEAGNRQHSFKFKVAQLMNGCQIILEHNPQTEQKIVTVETNEKEKLVFANMAEWRDKTLLLINSTKKNQQEMEQDLLEKLKKFVEMYTSLENVLESYNKLGQLGYFESFVGPSVMERKTFLIKNYKFDEITNHNNIVKDQCSKWEEMIDQAYINSFVFCHFQGRDLKRLGQDVKELKFNESLFRFLPNFTAQAFSQYANRREVVMDHKLIKTPLQLLKFIRLMIRDFEMYVPKMMKMISKVEKTVLYAENEVKVTTVALDQKVNLAGMLTPRAQNLDRVNMPQILLCRDTTNKYEIKTFLLRAIHDNSRPYFVIGTHYLHAQNQSIFCDVLKWALQNQVLKEKMFSMNLYFIDNSFNERIYNYMANHKDKIFKIRRTEELPADASAFFQKKAGDFTIVHSVNAGLGKTFWITANAKSKGKDCRYFPVAGNLNMDRLYKRILELKLKDTDALVIQIHNIKDIKILNEFLMQITFFKCLKHEGFFYLPEKLSIYIEIQNVLGQKHLQDIQVLSLVSAGRQNVVFIEKAEAKDVRISPNDDKFMFALKYLDMLEAQKIDKEELNFELFKKEKANLMPNQDRISFLVDNYLFKPLKSIGNQPSFIQLHSFLSLLYQSVLTFSTSFYYTVDQIGHYLRQFRGCGLQKYRSNHVELLVKNCREFLFRTVTENSFKANPTEDQIRQLEHFSETLREFPFLIVPNADLTAYSFVYKQADKVDPLIQKYTAIQDGLLKLNEFNNTKVIFEKFKAKSLSAMTLEQLQAQMVNMLMQMAHVNAPQDRQLDPDYSLTLDNFYKMCLIIQRMRAGLPIIIMGETGVGKTALIRFLVEKIFRDRIMLLNIHAGTNESVLIKYHKDILKARQDQADDLKKYELAKQRLSEVEKQFEARKKAKTLDQAFTNHCNLQREQFVKIKNPGKKLWVFFDEFNTSQEVGYIKDVIMDRKFMGQDIPEDIVFLAACNPFRNREEIKEKGKEKAGIKKKPNIHSHKTQNLLYKVLPPPESMIQIMWNFQELKTQEGKMYIKTIVGSKDAKGQPLIRYRPNEISEIIHITHEMLKEQIEKSAVNLRDVARFRILYRWFMNNMPKIAVRQHQRMHYIDYEYNYRIDQGERSFILSLCFCYYMRLPTFEKRQEYLDLVQKKMNYSKGHMSRVLETQQIDYLSRMQLPEGCALNLALRENVFTCLVCLMNKLPVIIVGKPGCSKSLSINLLVSNLRGRTSSEEYFRTLSQLQLFPFQGGQACTSEGVIQVFERAEKNRRPFTIPCILFDEIGLAENSVHNPLKVLHSRLEVNQTELAFIGISNWELDASKMARFLVVNRPVPDEADLIDTATKIFESYKDAARIQEFSREIRALSIAYYNFIKRWKERPNNDHPDFFGLRDFYSLIKYVCTRFLKQRFEQDKPRQVANIMRRSVQRNFDGRPDSIKSFLNALNEIYKHELFVRDEDIDTLGLIGQNIGDKQSRCLLQIVKGQALIYILNQKEVGVNKQSRNKVIMIHGSTFDQDRFSSEYNLLVISDIITYVGRGDIIIMKDVPNSIQTSLYDLLNKAYQSVGPKKFCRISVGAHYNPKCFVHPDFNCIVNIMENRLTEVDPPFLNRFEKHYLTFDQFLCRDEVEIIREVEDWLNRLLREHLKQQNPLINEHYIINICKESLGSLAIKMVMEAGERPDIQQCIKKAKKALIFNSTVDFRLLMQQFSPNNDDDKQLVENCFEAKQQFIKNDMRNVRNLIVYTYDQNAELYDENIFYQGKEDTKVIRFCDLKCQKDLRTVLDDFYRSKSQKVCHIKMNFGKESKHLCMVVFMLDSMAKKYENALKRVRIILVTSRLYLLNNKRYKQISYLNGFQQIFIENLAENALPVYDVPTRGMMIMQKFPRLFNFTELIPELFGNVIKRFYFVTRFGENPDMVDDYNNIIQLMSQTRMFTELCQKYIVGRLKQPTAQTKWKQQVLFSKDIANQAPDCEAAMRMCLKSRFEEDLAQYLNFLIENEVIYCFNPKESLQMLTKMYEPEDKNFLQEKFNRVIEAPQYKQIFERLIKALQPGPSKNFPRKISKVIGQQRREIGIPLLFPFAKRERGYILQKEKVNEEENKENDVKEETLEDYCAKIDDLEQQFYKKEERDQEDIGEIEAKLKQAENFFRSKTRLIDQRMDGEPPTYNFLQSLDNDPEWNGLKQLFLLDIINVFVSNSLQADLKESLKLRKALLHFVKPEASIYDQITTMLRGQSLWMKFSTIMRVFRQAHLLKQLGLFFDKFQNDQIDNKIQKFESRLKFMRYVTNNCDKFLFPDEKNIQILGGYKNYQFIFDNVYYILQGLENEYSGIEKAPEERIEVPTTMRLMRNFLKMIGNVAGEGRQQIVKQFLKEKQPNLYQRIHFFIEHIKETRVGEQLKYKDKMAFIVKYQSSNLFYFWLCDIKKRGLKEGQEVNTFTKAFILLANEHEDFAHYSGNVLTMIFDEFVNWDDPIDQICQNLNTGNIEQDIIMRNINSSIQSSNYNSNMAVVISDFFSRNITMPEADGKISEEQIAAFYVQEMFEDFEKLIEKPELNSLQNTAILGFFRLYLPEYINVLCMAPQNFEKVQQVNEAMVKVDRLLSKETALNENLRIYCMKLIRSKQKNLRDIFVKYININKADWLQRMREHFKTEDTPKQFSIPPEIGAAPIDALIKQFQDGGYRDVKLLQEMFKMKEPRNRYKLFTFFMTDIYSGLCGIDQKIALHMYIAETQDDNLEPFEKYLLERYCQGNITNEISYQLDEEIGKLSGQTWILNNINWLLSVRRVISPLTSIFFNELGKIPQNFAQNLNEQFLITGKDNPFRSIIENISAVTPKAAFYICSKTCDFVYTVEGCGWPAVPGKCNFCDSQISGGGHQLVRWNEGARRLGPNVLFKNNTFVEGNYEASNTWHSPFYLGSLVNLSAYWRSIPAYMQRQIDRIREKKEVMVRQRIDKNTLGQPVKQRLTGYSKFTIEGLSRIHNYTNHFLMSTINSLFYFFLSFKWISEEECTKTFDGKTSQQMLKHTYSIMTGEVSKLKSPLDHPDWTSWIMGLQNIIYTLSVDFPQQLRLAKDEKQRQNEVERVKYLESKAQIGDKTQQMLMDRIVAEAVVFDLPQAEHFSAHRCSNRDFFEKLVETQITKFSSGQDKITFIKNSKKYKGQVAYPFDAVLLEQNTNDLNKFIYLRILRLATNPSRQHMEVEYNMKIKKDYPILYFLITKLGQLQNLRLFWNVVNFSNQITRHAQFFVARDKAKNIQVSKFLEQLKVEEPTKQKLFNLLAQSCSSWNKLAKQIGVVQYECKVLGKMNDNYTPKEPLIAFLVDSLENTNYHGKMLSGVMHLFAASHNQLIKDIEDMKQGVPEMRDVQMFPERKYLPQKITENDILRMDESSIEKYVNNCSSSSVKYGNGIPLYNFELIQYKLTNMLYGKKRLIEDMKHYINVQFGGQVFSRQGKYSNYITEVRAKGANRPLELNEIDKLTVKFKEMRERDENNFYNLVKSIQGFIQKIMIFYKNLQGVRITIGGYIQKYAFRNPPELMVELPIKNLPIQSIVSLYEFAEGLIINKIFEILHEDYKSEKLTEFDEESWKAAFKKMRNADRDQPLPKFEQFKAAFYRLTVRCLSLAEIPKEKSLMEFLPARQDFWPYNDDDQKRQNLVELNCDITLTKVFSLYELIEAEERPIGARPIRPLAAVQEQNIDVRRVTRPNRARGKAAIITG